MMTDELYSICFFLFWRCFLRIIINKSIINHSTQFLCFYNFLEIMRQSLQYSLINITYMFEIMDDRLSLFTQTCVNAQGRYFEA